jgi:replicative DNA helicase
MTPDEYVLGGCLLSPDAIPFATKHIDPGDFASAANETVFRAMVQLRNAGEPVEPFTVITKATALGARGVDIADLHTWIAGTGSAASVEHYAREVREQATRRRLSQTATGFHRDITDPAVPTADAVQKMLSALKAIRDQSTVADLMAKTLGEILDIPEEDADWVIPGLLERGDRMIITGWEGLGKTTWIRQIAICAAAGINPVTLDLLPRPVRGLVVDVENSEKQWRRETRGIAATAAKHGTSSPRDNLWIHCGGRMDLRRDKDLGLVHRLVDEHQPELLFIGPIYRLVPTGINSDEEAAPLIAALDTLRDRGLVLVMEAHAPKGQLGERNLAPRGSAALMGWPEFGFGLAPTETGAEVKRWRADRDRKRDWPTELWKGGPFPWTAGNVADTTRRSFYAGAPGPTEF